MSHPRVLIVSALSGEPQWPEALRRLGRQVNVELTVETVTGLGLREAMERLRELGALADDADYVLKVDGDMVPRHDDSVWRLVQAARLAAVDRLTTPVADFYTDTQISGIHLLRQQAVSRSRPAEVAHRPDSWIDGIHGVTWRRAIWPAFLHAPDPDVPQSLRFGLQRSTKAVLDGPSSSHWSTLMSLLANARRRDHVSLWAAAFGAWVGLGHHPAFEAGDRSVIDQHGEAFRSLALEARDAHGSAQLRAWTARATALREVRARHGRRAALTAGIRHVRRRLGPWASPHRL